MNISHLFGRKVSLALIAFNLFVPSSVMAEEEPTPVYNLDITDTDLVYNGTEHEPAFSLTDKDGEPIPSTAYTSNYSHNKDAGKGILTITDADDEDEYPDVNLSKEFSIAPKEISIVWPTTTDFTYDGSEKNITPTFDNVEADDEINATITNDKATEVGSYTAEVEINNANYKLPSNNSKVWTISSPAIGEVEIVLSIPTDGYTYDKTAKEPAVSVMFETTEIPASEYTIEYSNNTNAGEASVTVTDKEGGNYSIPTTTETFSIAPKEIAIVWPTTTDFTYDGSEKNVTPTFDNVEADDEINATITNDKATEVGSYTAEVEINNANYKLPSNNSKVWTISSPAIGEVEIVLSIPTDGYTYDKTAKEPAVSVMFETTEIPASEYTVEYSNNTNAGEATVTVTDKEGGNYSIPTASKNFSIAPKEISIVWPTTTDFTYDGSEKNVTPTFDNVEADDEINATITNDKATEVGSYTAEVEINNANYKLPSNNSKAWTISSPAIGEVEIVLSIPTDGYTYDKTAKEPAVSVMYETTEIPASEYTIEYSDNTNSGEATVTVTDKEGGNYSIPTTTETFSIAPKEIAIVWPTITDFTYDGSEKNITPTFDNVEADDEINATITNDKATEVGSYTAEVEINNANYKLPSVSSKAWTISSPAIGEVEIVLSIPTDGYTYDKTAKEPAVSVMFETTEIPASEYNIEYSDNTNAGEATVTVTDKEGGNYAIPTASKNFSIAPKEIAIVWPTTTDFTYDGSEKNVTPTFDNVEADDEINATITNDKATEVGSYTAEVEINNANYKLPSNNSKAWTISSPAIGEVEIVLSIPDEGYTYDKTAKEPAVSVMFETTEIPASEYTIEYSDNTNAGKATVTVTDKEGGNYSIPTTTETFSIAPKEIAIVWPTTTDFTYDGSEKNVTPTFDNVEADDEINATITNDKATEVGSYTAEVEINNANYKLPSNNSKAWTINSKSASSATLVLGIPDGGYTYDKTAKEPTVTVMLDEYVVPSNEYEIVYSDNINAGSNAKVTVLDKEGGNYTIPTTTETFTIAQKEITITWSETLDFTYDGNKKSITAEISGKVADDELNDEIDNNTAYNAGEYNAVLSINNSNYKLPSNISQAWTISPRSLNADDYVISIPDIKNIYNKLPQEPAVSITTKDGNIVPASEYSVVYGNNINAGSEATIMVSNKAGGNYILSEGSRNFTIEPKTLGISWSSPSTFTYDGTEKNVEPTITEIVDGDDIKSKTTGDKATNKGNHKAVVTIDNSNYKLPANDSQDWSISPRILTADEYTISIPDIEYIYKKAAHEPVVTITTKDNVVIPNTEYTVSYKDNTYVGTATISVKDKDGNYQLFENSRNFEITPKELTVIWSTPTEFTYSGTEKIINATVSGTFPGDNINKNILGNKATIVGSYSASVTIDNENYKLSDDAVQPWKITSRTLEAADYEISLSSNSYTYDGSAHTPDVVISTNEGTTLPVTEYTVTYQNNKNAGTAKVIIGDKTDGNFTVKEKSTTFNIAQKRLAVVWSTPNDFTYDGTEKNVDATVNGVVEGDDIKKQITGNSAVNVGEYTAEVSIDNSNYKLSSNTTYDWSVSSKESQSVIIKINIPEGGYIYDGTEKTPKVTVMIGETVVPDKEYEVSYSDNINASNIAKVTIKDKEGGNYTLRRTSESFSIAPRVLAVKWPEQTEFVYDGTQKTIKAAINGAVPGDEIIEKYEGNKAINAGKLTAVLSIDDDNYKLPDNASQDWEITPKSLSAADYVVTVNNANETYNGLAHTPAVSITTKNGATVPDTEYSVAYKNNVNAGNADVIVSDVEGGNYVIEEGSKNFTINPKTLTVTWSTPLSFTYDGSEKSITPTITDFVEGETVINKVTGNTATAVGEYTAVVTIDNSNYKLPSKATQAWSIKAKNVNPDDVTVTINGNEALTYNGAPQTPEVSVAIDGIPVPTSEYEIHYSNNTAAGEASVTIKDVPGGDYTIGNTTVNFTIKPKEVTLVWTQTEFVYTGMEQTIMPVVEGVIEGDFVNLALTGNKATDNGSYVATVTKIDNPNYMLVGHTTQDWIISAKSISSDEIVITVNNNKVITYNGTPQTPDVVISIGTTVIPADEYKVEYSNNTNAGEAIIYITDNVGGDFSISDNTVNFTIQPKTVTLSWPKTEYAFTGTEQTIMPVIEGVVTGDSINPILTGNKAKENGSYIAKVTAINNSNYKLVGDSTQTWRINGKNVMPVDAVVTINDKKNVIYNGTAQTPSVVITMGADTIPDTEYELSYTNNIAVGVATISIKDKVGGNYTIGFNSVKFSILPKPTTLTWANTDLVYSGAEQTIIPTIEGIVDGDLVNATTTGNKATNMGVYTAKVTKIDNPNYVLVGDSTKIWKISPKDITPADAVVTVNNNEAVTYNGTAHVPAVVMTVGTTVIPTDEYEVAYSNNIAAGQAHITIKDKANGNYTIADNTVNFTILQKEVTLSWLNTELYYNGIEQGVTPYVDGVIDNDIVVPTTIGNRAVAMGNYVAKVTSIDNMNYKLVGDSTLAWMIQAKALTPNEVVVTVNNNEDIVYDGTAHTPNIVIVTGNDTIPASEYSIAYSDNTESGLATITIRDNIGGGYTIADNSVSFNILPKEVTLSWGDTVFTYNEEEHTIVPKIDGVIGNDIVTPTLTGNRETEIGEYMAVVTEINNPNYKLVGDSAQAWTILPIPHYTLAITSDNDTLTLLKFTLGDTITTKIIEGLRMEKEGYSFVGYAPSFVEFVINKDTTFNAVFALKSYVITGLKYAEFGLCPNTEDRILFSKEGEGSPREYRITFDKEATEVGFENTEFRAIEQDGVLPITIPDCKAGQYKAKIQFRNYDESLSREFDLVLDINLSSDYIIDIWSDVISAVNLEERFLEYQWYHNERKLEGATSPYYCELGGLTGSYYMNVVTVDGEKLHTCKKWFNAIKDKIILIAYPNPTSDYVTVELSYDNGGTHQLIVIDDLGGHVLRTTFSGQKTLVDFTKFPAGAYVINVDGEFVKEIKK
ncbi:MAG: hypothetical protein MJZ19_05065 [Paludibacteraceae bacterium]|nr:hypothetical protein [Paludibacteraceae bacterium]